MPTIRDKFDHVNGNSTKNGWGTRWKEKRREKWEGIEIGEYMQLGNVGKLADGSPPCV